MFFIVIIKWLKGSSFVKLLACGEYLLLTDQIQYTNQEMTVHVRYESDMIYIDKIWTRAPPWPNFLHFHAVFSKNSPNNTWPPLGISPFIEIRDRSPLCAYAQSAAFVNNRTNTKGLFPDYSLRICQCLIQNLQNGLIRRGVRFHFEWEIDLSVPRLVVQSDPVEIGDWWCESFVPVMSKT